VSVETLAMEVHELREAAQRQAAALEKLCEQLAFASLPAVMKKTRAARELDVSPATLARLIKSGDIRLNKDGKVPASEVLRYAAVQGRERPKEKTAKHDAQAEAEKLRKARVP
jgi:hypothetical protein